MSADFWAGYISGAAGIIIGNPLDLIKTRLQAGTTPAPHVVEATPTTTITAAAAVQPQLQTLQGFKAQFENAGTLVRGETNNLNTAPPLFSHVTNSLLLEQKKRERERKPPTYFL